MRFPKKKATAGDVPPAVSLKIYRWSALTAPMVEVADLMFVTRDMRELRRVRLFRIERVQSFLNILRERDNLPKISGKQGLFGPRKRAVGEGEDEEIESFSGDDSDSLKRKLPEALQPPAVLTSVLSPSLHSQGRKGH